MTYEVLQRLRRSNEVTPPPLNEANRLRYLPVQLARFDAIPSDRIVGCSDEEWRRLRIARRQEQLSR